MRRKLACVWLGLLFLAPAGSTWSADASQSAAESANLEQNKALVRRWINEGFNKKKLNIVDELFVDNFVVNGQRIGRVGLKQSMSQRFVAFPDLRVTILEAVAEGDKVAIWYSAEGAQLSEFEGVPGTGKAAKWLGADLLRIERGRIAEGRFLDDSLGLMRQLGARLVPPGKK